MLPALFPFFFFTKLLSGLGFPEQVGKLCERPVRFLFKTPPLSAYVFFMSVLCGYPVGARLVSDFYKNNLLNEAESKKIIAFCSTSAPLFVIGTVGNYMLNNQKYALIILVAHYLSAICTGLFFCNIRPLTPSRTCLPPTVASGNVIGDGVDGAVISVLSVGGLIAIFSLIIDVLADCGVLTLFGDGALPYLTGIIEMTRGCAEISKCGLPAPLTIAVITAFISFGGLCVFAQAMSYLAEAKIKARYYLAVKIIQAAFGGLLGYALGLLAV